MSQAELMWAQSLLNKLRAAAAKEDTNVKQDNS